MLSSARLSYLSVVSEVSATGFEDHVKSCTLSFAGSLGLENDCLEVDEMKRKSCRGHEACSTSYFSLLMENLCALESTFLDSDALRLEKEIMLQLGRIGGLKVSSTCLSKRIVTDNVLNLSDVSVERVGESEKNGVDDRNGKMGKIVVRSKRKGRRKLKTGRVMEQSNDAYLLPLPSNPMLESFQKVLVSSEKKSSRTRSGRLVIARNEAELSRGIKVISDVEYKW